MWGRSSVTPCATCGLAFPTKRVAPPIRGSLQSDSQAFAGAEVEFLLTQVALQTTNATYSDEDAELLGQAALDAAKREWEEHVKTTQQLATNTSKSVTDLSGHLRQLLRDKARDVRLVAKRGFSDT